MNKSRVRSTATTLSPYENRKYDHVPKVKKKRCRHSLHTSRPIVVWATRLNFLIPATTSSLGILFSPRVVHTLFRFLFFEFWVSAAAFRTNGHNIDLLFGKKKNSKFKDRLKSKWRLNNSGKPVSMTKHTPKKILVHRKLTKISRTEKLWLFGHIRKKAHFNDVDKKLNVTAWFIPCSHH